MHYSIVPNEVIFEDWDEAELNYQEITYDGRQFLVEPMEENQARIVQLISSDPMDFMEMKYQPGCVIEFTPQPLNK